MAYSLNGVTQKAEILQCCSETERSWGRPRLQLRRRLPKCLLSSPGRDASFQQQQVKREALSVSFTQWSHFHHSKQSTVNDLESFHCQNASAPSRQGLRAARRNRFTSTTLCSHQYRLALTGAWAERVGGSDREKRLLKNIPNPFLWHYDIMVGKIERLPWNNSEFLREQAMNTVQRDIWRANAEFVWPTTLKEIKATFCLSLSLCFLGIEV